MTLARYLMRNFIGAILLCLVGLSMLVVVVNLVENAGKLTDIQDGAAIIALRLAIYSSVELSYQVLPVATLFGLLIAGTVLAQRGELLAIQATGGSQMMVWAAFLIVATGASLLGVACGETLNPHAKRMVQYIERVELRGRVDKLSSFFDRRSHWFQHEDLILFLPEVDDAGQVFSDPLLYRFDDGLVAEVIEAQRMMQRDGTWMLEQAHVHSIAEAGSKAYELLPIDLNLSNRDLMGVAGNPQLMSSARVMQLIERRTRAGFATLAHRVELHNRLAYPSLCIWLMLVALPWALNPNRQRSLAVTLGGGVAGVAVMFSVLQTLRLLALGGKLPPVIGAWGTAFFCLLGLPVSFLLYRRVRSRGGLF